MLAYPPNQAYIGLLNAITSKYSKLFQFSMIAEVTRAYSMMLKLGSPLPKNLRFASFEDNPDRA